MLLHISYLYFFIDCPVRYERGSCDRSGVLRHKMQHDLEHIKHLATQLDIKKAKHILPRYTQAYAAVHRALAPAEKEKDNDAAAYEFIVDTNFLKVLGKKANLNERKY